MINEKFLPIGTVVILKGGKKRLMITGFCMMDKNNATKLYDYCGCLYPEGTMSTEQIALFDHEQIDKVFYVGYSDLEEKNFKTQLIEFLKTRGTQAPATSAPEQSTPVPPIGPGLENLADDDNAGNIPPIGPGL